MNKKISYLYEFLLENNHKAEADDLLKLSIDLPEIVPGGRSLKKLAPSVFGKPKKMGEVYLVVNNNSKPLSYRIKPVLQQALGADKANKAIFALDAVVPQGHGGVYLKKSNGQGVYFDFGMYGGHCSSGSKLSRNFIDQAVYNIAPIVAAPGNVREKGSIPAGEKHYCGEALDKDIDEAISRARSLKNKCIGYTIAPGYSAGVTYNCGTFAITIAAMARLGTNAFGVLDSLVQRVSPTAPASSIPMAAATLRALFLN